MALVWAVAGFCDSLCVCHGDFLSLVHKQPIVPRACNTLHLCTPSRIAGVQTLHNFAVDDSARTLQAPAKERQDGVRH